MTNLFQAEESSPNIQAPESSPNIGKRIAVAIAILALSGLALWVGVEKLLRLTSGHS
jgi:hypothetical protein